MSGGVAKSYEKGGICFWSDNGLVFERGHNSGMEWCVAVGTGLIERNVGDKEGEGSAWGS